MLKVITVTNNIEATMPLINSLQKNGWEFVVIEFDVWRGFGTKLIETYNFLKLHPEVDEFIFCDAFDVICLGSSDDFDSLGSNILVSAERGCWPVPDWEKLYANRFDHGFNYVNSGLYYAKSEAFIGLIESDMPDFGTDDQLWFTKHFLNEGVMIGMDNNCEMFQSYSFIQDDDYLYNVVKGALYNKKTNTFPVFVHGNGRTDMTKIHQLIAQ